ncbi:50S ribosomal protein L4 [soil metagenome]
MAAAKKTPVKNTNSEEVAPKAARTRKAVSEVKAETPIITTPVAKKTTSTVKTDVFDLTGKVVETISLPETLFGAKVNPKLMTQAVRVYMANQRKGTQSTKTRSEVTGSTRKIYRQKGTGRARHGGITAPIFVGGGIALGPKPRDYSMSLPQKMRRAALVSALTVKLQDGKVKVVDGFEKVEPKTKVFVEALNKLNLNDKKKKILLVLPEKTDTVTRAMRNIEGITYINAQQLNTYEVINTKTLVVMKSAIATLEKTFSQSKKETK